MNEETRNVNQGDKGVYVEQGNVNIYQAGSVQTPPISESLTPSPFIPEVFLDRERELEQIHKLLWENGSPLFITGEAGVGKTALAAVYYNKYRKEYKHVAWVYSEHSIADALLLFAPNLGLEFDEHMSTDARLDKLLIKMESLPQPCLLVIDHVNRLADVEAQYNNLRRCSNFHLLITTRISRFGHANFLRVPGLPENTACELFERHMDGTLAPETRKVFVKIWNAVNGNTLVLELLAKNLRKLNFFDENSYPLETLLADLQKKGLLQLTQSEPVRYLSHDGTLRNEKAEDIITAMYDIGALQKQEAAILSIFSILPAQGIPYDDLKHLLKPNPEFNKHLQSLIEKGWIEFNRQDKIFKCSPVIQEVTRNKNLHLLGDSMPLIRALTDKLAYSRSRSKFRKATPDQAAQYAWYAENVLHALNTPNDNLFELGKRLGKYHTVTGNIEKALVFLEKCVQLAEGMLAADPDNVERKAQAAVAYGKLGEAYKAFGDLDNTLLYLQKDLEYSKDLYERSEEDDDYANGLAISYKRLGEAQKSIGAYPEAFDCFTHNYQLTLQLSRKHPEQRKYRHGLAIALSKLGDTCMALEQFEDALEYFENDLEISAQLNASTPDDGYDYGLPVSYSRVGEALMELGRYEEAKERFIESLRLRERKAGRIDEKQVKRLDVIYGLTIANGKVGEACMALKLPDEALPHFQRSEQMAVQLCEIDPNNLDYKYRWAVAEKNLGLYHQQNSSDKSQAKTYLENAKEVYKALIEQEADIVKFGKELEEVERALRQ